MDCIICGGRIDAGEIVTVTRGLQTIIEASEARHDGLCDDLHGVGSATVHENCRKRYIRPSNIAAAIQAKDNSTNVITEGDQERQLRSSVQSFDFKVHCLLCGDDATNNKRLPKERQRPVSNVSTIEIKQSLIDISMRRKDEWGDVVRSRVEATFDLVAAEGRYHRDCHKKFIHIDAVSGIGRPEDPVAGKAFRSLCEYIDTNDECQYSLSELLETMTSVSEPNASYTEKHLKRKLLDHYKSEIVITKLPGKVSIVSRRETSHRILTDAWYAAKESNEVEERMRVVRAAAEIIREDIRSSVNDCRMYPVLTDLDTLSTEQVPETLREFTSIVTKVRDTTAQGIIRKRSAINHAVIAACRPRSFLSSIQIGTAVYLHRKYGSMHLIDVLAAMGFCASYQEARRYLQSVMTATPPHVDSKAFVQFVFDNADVNTRTLDGFGTFHATGGIKCVTPATSVTTNLIVPRKCSKMSAIRNEASGIEILAYQKPASKQLQEILVENLDSHRSVLQDCSSSENAFKMDALWLTGCLHDIAINMKPGWNGFMTTSADNSRNYVTSRVLIMPFINLEASNLTSIYSALKFACKQSKLNDQPSIVTFDQPLYLKARAIVAAEPDSSELKYTVVRLGGFHLLMSYLGSIGNIMDGSGIEDLWQMVYGKSTINHLLTGHAYARAIRAHQLTYQALITLLVQDSPEVTGTLTEEIKQLYEDVLSNKISSAEASKSPHLINFSNALNTAMMQMSSTGRTPALWIQYMRQVELMFKFIRAEREGNWNLHLDSVVAMLPYFHAAGHVLYAKSAHLYAQDMCTLESRIPSNVHSDFTSKGFFTLRRSDRAWSGVWSDMCIEQTLMRSLKTTGGLTRGRGINEQTLMTWVETAPASVAISEAFESYLNVGSQSSEQHVELRPSRQLRDAKDRQKFVEWLQKHSPFGYASKGVVNIASGRISDSTVNCDKAYEVGLTLMKTMIGQNFADLKMRRKDKVKSQATAGKGIKVRDDIVAVNPQQLFHRIMCVSNGSDDLKRFFKYELASVPPSLFDDMSLRKGTKSSLVPSLCPGTEQDECIPADTYYVVDGGNLLHAVFWPRPCTYNDVYTQYTSHLERLYGRRCTVVFDGYPDTPTTKGEEQRRRSCREMSCDILFEGNMFTSTSQSQFLNNKTNKQRLILGLSQRLVGKGITVVHSDDDADTNIVHEALKLSSGGQPVTIVGNDTDLLVLLAASARPTDNIFLLKPGTSSKQSKIIKCQSMLTHLGELTSSVLFIHAMTGCDTTSALYRKGKMNAVQIVKKSNFLRDVVKAFYDPQASKEVIAEAGEKFLLKLYGSINETTLDDLRFSLYMKSTARLAMTSTFVLASLPPTSAAAQQHSLRVYLQVQRWLGITHEATNYGWKLENGHLIPVTTTLQPVPDDILNLVSCNCKSLCKKACGCRRLGLHCSVMCGQCQGVSCTNTPPVELEDGDDGGEEGEEDIRDNSLENDKDCPEEYDYDNNDNVASISRKRQRSGDD